MSNEYAIFVSPTGKDGAGGSKAGPVKTMAKAIELAGNTKIIVACNGTFDEQVKLTTGVKLYGGFACPGSATPWVYESGKKATVAPSTKGYALNIATGTLSVVIEDFEFDALDGTDSGESSVAAMVSSSNQVALNRVKLVAGKGVDGAKGTLTQFTFPDQMTLNGKPAMANLGGLANPYAQCPGGGITKGGGGGTGGPNPTGGDSGAPDLGAGKGGSQGACLNVGTGQDGADAMPQPPAAGATKLGTITSTGWTGAPGSDGTPGTPGQGGGGGTGAATGGGGGGGGAGSCGGAPGTGGKAGGSSIALLVLNSTIALSASELVAGNAGKGGDGVAGQDGQSQGGNGGLPDVSGGCQGGKGGKGGKGGAGGGAAGGVSLGIAYQGMAPSTDAATTFTTGALGAKGLGGVPGTNDGIDGVKQDVLLVP